MTTAKFIVGNVYEMNFIGDSNLRPKFICVSRTDKSASFVSAKNSTEKLTRRIKIWDNAEYVLEGTYSMAPRIKAN